MEAIKETINSVNTNAVGCCWVWPRGRLEFGVECPDGALLIMHGAVRAIKELVEATARIAYPSDVDMADVWLVPGMPEAVGQLAAYEALQRWLVKVKAQADTHKIVFSINTASNRAVRRGTAQKLYAEMHR